MGYPILGVVMTFSKEHCSNLGASILAIRKTSVIKSTVLAGIICLLAACGGSEPSSDGGILANGNNNGSGNQQDGSNDDSGNGSNDDGLIPTTPDTPDTPPEPPEDDTSEPPVATPPITTPDPIPDPQPLSKPNASVLVGGSRLNVSWDNVQAVLYRVMIWSENSRTPETRELEVTSTTIDTSLSGELTLVVEAYDVLGNSVFSDPLYMEVSP